LEDLRPFSLFIRWFEWKTGTGAHESLRQKGTRYFCQKTESGLEQAFEESELEKREDYAAASGFFSP
jgi:hypothetical protein